MPTPRGEVLLEAEELHSYYGESHVLHGVSLRIHRGETLSLMGRNGMGKTTTLRSLTGLTPPRSGRVRVRGDDVTGSPPHRVARLGVAFVPENRGIFPNLTVRENLIMTARPGPDGRNDWPLDRVLAVFPRLGERLGNYGNQLSGGEQQMLTVGRALMTHPDLILLDEPTEGLAPLMRREIWNVVREIRAAGIASVIVDRDLATVRELADWNLVMVKGRIVCEGSREDFAADPERFERHLAV